MRELSDSSIADQVDQLQGYVARGGSAVAWLLSKNFGAADTAAIEAELRRRREAA
jgi:hypothetical protein